MGDLKHPLVRFAAGLVLPALEDLGVELETETAADGYSTIVRLPERDDDLRRVVSIVLQPSVWWRTRRMPQAKPHAARTRSEWLPRWSGLGAVARDDVPRLLEAWRQGTSRRGNPEFIRVSVNPHERSDLLRLAARIGQPVVPSARWLSGVAFTWHYPVRVTAAGPSRDRMLQELRSLPRVGADFVVTDHSPDVCFVRGREYDPMPGCGTVVAIGSKDAFGLFSSAVWNKQSPGGVAVAAGVPRSDLSWWHEVIAAMVGNLPLDCALASVVPEACVGGISAALTATTLGYEAAGWRAAAIDTRFVGPGTRPDMEGEGPELGGSITSGARGVRREGSGASLDRRRLRLEFRDGARTVRAVLPPNRELSLEVAVGRSGRGHLALTEPLAVPHPEAPVVTLDVVVNCKLWAEPQRCQVAWSVHNYDQDSTSAVFSFATPSSGAMVITVDVLYRGRIVQQADVLAAVRDRALRGERIRVEARPTSATTGSTADPCEHSLDATGSDLRNVLTGEAVPLASLEGMLDDFELQASRVLGNDEAPEALCEDSARKLLIALARRGAGLRDQLAVLALRPSNAGTVSVLVHEQTRVLPLELVYEGEPPTRGAQLCEHATAPPPLGEACDRTGPGVVCPYAFWSLSRTVVRTVVVPNASSPRVLEPLRLRPVLFAASDRADLGSQPHAQPSDTLERVCVDLLGDVRRVRGWGAWQREIRSTQPELLVLLAHTQLDAGEASLQIGKNSTLARPDISAAVVGRSPLVLLVACRSAVAGDTFGTLGGALTARGASAVVGLLTQVTGDHGSRAAVAVLTELCATGQTSLSRALFLARRNLVAQGLLVGMLIVAHGETDVVVQPRAEG